MLLIISGQLIFSKNLPQTVKRMSLIRNLENEFLLEIGMIQMTYIPSFKQL